MKVMHIYGPNVEVIDIDYTLEGIKKDLDLAKLKPADASSADDASGYTINHTELHDVVTVFDYDGSEEHFIGPKGTFDIRQ